MDYCLILDKTKKAYFAQQNGDRRFSLPNFYDKRIQEVHDVRVLHGWGMTEYFNRVD